MRALLYAGVIAGPIYILVGGAQIVTREGFDMTRHPLSMLSLGELGWIQVSNFLVTGFLVFLASIALWQLAKEDKLLKWSSVLIGLYGVCVIGGGIFTADPALGFPPGTPNTYPQTFSSRGLLHFIFGQIAFLSLISASFVYARYFAKKHVRKWLFFSALTGGIFLAAIVSLMATMNAPWSSILLYFAVALGWMWLSAISLRALKK